MTHSLIKSNGTVLNLTSGQIEKLDNNIKAKFNAMVDFNKFMESNLPRVFDLMEPSNTTLAYLAITLAGCMSYVEDKAFIDPVYVNRSIICENGSIAPYIDAANQCLDRVNPKSMKYAYRSNAGMVSKPNAQDDFISRLQVIMEPILYNHLNNESITVVVSQDFDVPYILNCFANVSVWTPEQYENLEKLKDTTEEVETEEK